MKVSLDFKNINPPIVVHEDSQRCLFPASTNICDKNGNLLFYTNGFEVYDREDNKMPNGINFNGGSLSNAYFSVGCYPLSKSSIFLPFPKDSTKFYLFYENMEWSIEGNKFPDKLRYLIIDKSINSSFGDVIQKDIPLITNDTLMDGGLLSLKHGNGIDYWLIAKKYKSNKYFVFLIDSSGIHKYSEQHIGYIYLEPYMELGIPNCNYSNNKIAYSYVSFNSTPNIRQGQIDLLDFDRCNGVLSNYKKTIIDNVIDTLNAISLCFSPSNRFLYVSDNYNIWQLDLNASNVLHSKFLVGTRLNGETYSFLIMKNAIDGKIYIANNGACRFIHVINQPDSLGLNCNFVQKQIDLGQSYYSTGGLPNTPNFALGAIAPCGNVGVAEVKEEELKIKNLYGVGEVLQIPINHIQIKLYNTLGQQVYENNNYSNTFTLHEKGLFIYTIYNTATNQWHSGKLEVQ
jgi:hypothetical protein